MTLLGRGFYAKLSRSMIADADAIAHARLSADATEDQKVIEIIKARCERAARIYFPPLPNIVPVSGLHQPNIDPEKYYLFILAAEMPYFNLAGWLRGNEMVGRRIKLEHLHKTHTLVESIKADMLVATMRANQITK